MNNIQSILDQGAPASLEGQALKDWPKSWPVRDRYHPSPSDWRDEVFYFLLPDRFSNGMEEPKNLLTWDLSTPKGVQQIRVLRGPNWRWDLWRQSGQDRFQGGTLAGIQSKLGYLSDLGVTTLWIGPVFRQRVEENCYLQVSGRNLNACLDIGEQREIVCNVAKGLKPASEFFDGFNCFDEGMPSHRDWGSRHLSISDDHDHVFGAKVRLSADASNDHQAAAVAALQLFTLGIPCLYYGTEQGLASGAEPEEHQYLPWGSHDCLLREAMFGPVHPRASG